VRRLRSSFTIPTSPGRNARTVSGFNRRPIYATSYGRLCPTLRGLRLAGRALAILGWARSPPYGNNRQIAPGPSVLQDISISDMNDLSKDAVNWLAVLEDGQGQRVDNYLVKVLKGVPKSHIYRILRSGEVRVNRRKVGPDTRLNVGDQLRIPPIRASAPSRKAAVASTRAVAIPPILFEDDALLALDKPAGLAVHGGSGISYGVIERLRLARPDAAFLELVHRLDRETSGVLLVAKKRLALTGLHSQLRDGAIDKRYSVLVRGKWRDALRAVEMPLSTYVTGDGERRVRADKDGRLARTIFRRVAVWPRADPPVALLDAELETGRTHQIRVHLTELGFPLAGDDKYGDFAWNRVLARQGLKRMFLHARRIRFAHPGDGREVVIEAPLPPELAAYVARLDAASHA
jgi:23S rRNA pseudouridine955/2504/2580 synthase